MPNSKENTSSSSGKSKGGDTKSTSGKSTQGGTSDQHKKAGEQSNKNK